MTAPNWLDGSVHPHVCGEGGFDGWDLGDGLGSPPRVWGRPLPLFVEPDISGSPPRVWGRLRHAGRVLVRRRFTPTCVGKA